MSFHEHFSLNSMESVLRSKRISHHEGWSSQLLVKKEGIEAPFLNILNKSATSFHINLGTRAWSCNMFF